MSGLLPRSIPNSGNGVFTKLDVNTLTVNTVAFINDLIVGTITLANLVVGTITGNPNINIVATTASVNGDEILTVGNIKTITGKTIDSAANTLTITNSPLSGTNINTLINQDVRTTSSPTFAGVVTPAINGNADLAITADRITATVNQPFSMILNNTSTTFSNELRVQNNGTTIIGFGNNNSTNEAFCWTYANQPLKFATNSTERLRIAAAGIANDNTITSVLGLQGTSLVFKNNIVDTTSSQTLSNKAFVDILTSIVDSSDSTKRLLFDINGNAGTNTTITSVQTANRVITLPNATTILVGDDTTQTLTNKTLTLPTIASINNGGTLTLPTGPQTLIGRTTTDTLTNKTIDSATNTLTITNSPLSATNINTLINQDVRTTAGPTFTSAVNLTQSGNTTFTILTKSDYAYSASNGSFFTSSVIGDINLRNQDNTKSLNIGVGNATAQLRIDNTGVNYNVGQNTFIGGVKSSSITPVTGSQTNGATTTIFSFTLATSQAIYIYVSVVSKKLVGTQTGWSSIVADFKCINNATVVTANAGSFGSATSQTAILGTYNGKLTLAANVVGQTVNINLANTYADNSHQYTAEIDVMYVA